MAVVRDTMQEICPDPSEEHISAGMQRHLRDRGAYRHAYITTGAAALLKNTSRTECTLRPLKIPLNMEILSFPEEAQESETQWSEENNPTLIWPPRHNISPGWKAFSEGDLLAKYAQCQGILVATDGIRRKIPGENR